MLLNFHNFINYESSNVIRVVFEPTNRNLVLGPGGIDGRRASLFVLNYLSADEQRSGQLLRGKSSMRSEEQAKKVSRLLRRSSLFWQPDEISKGNHPLEWLKRIFALIHRVFQSMSKGRTHLCATVRPLHRLFPFHFNPGIISKSFREMLTRNKHRAMRVWKYRSGKKVCVHLCPVCAQQAHSHAHARPGRSDSVPEERVSEWSERRQHQRSRIIVFHCAKERWFTRPRCRIHNLRTSCVFSLV